MTGPSGVDAERRQFLVRVLCPELVDVVFGKNFLALLGGQIGEGLEAVTHDTAWFVSKANKSSAVGQVSPFRNRPVRSQTSLPDVFSEVIGEPDGVDRPAEERPRGREYKVDSAVSPAMVDPGDPAPEVQAPNQHGELVAPDLEGPTVVYFYVEDGTPGCATQADQFTLEAEVYEEADVAVYGVSTDDVDSHRAFADEHGVEYDLLADPDGEVCEAFGVPRDHGGRAERTTVVIVDGEVHRVYEGVSADGHARDVLLDLLDDGLVSID